MNHYQQSEEVAKEVERYHAYRRSINRRTMLRGLTLGNQVKLVRIGYRFVWKNRLKGQRADVSLARRKELELLCSEGERSSPFFGIVRSAQGTTVPALSDHVIETFPDFDWPALGDVIRLRIDHQPKHKLKDLLEYMGLLVPLVPALYLVCQLLEGHLPALGVNADWTASGLNDWIASEWNDMTSGGLIALIYLLAALLTYLVKAHGTRMRLQRAAEILTYIEIRARAGDLSAAGHEPDRQSDTRMVSAGCAPCSPRSDRRHAQIRSACVVHGAP